MLASSTEQVQLSMCMWAEGLRKRRAQTQTDILLVSSLYYFPDGGTKLMGSRGEDEERIQTRATVEDYIFYLLSIYVILTSSDPKTACCFAA